jgi:hypothetical protein
MTKRSYEERAGGTTALSFEDTSAFVPPARVEETSLRSSFLRQLCIRLLFSNFKNLKPEKKGEQNMPVHVSDIRTLVLLARVEETTRRSSFVRQATYRPLFSDPLLIVIANDRRERGNLRRLLRRYAPRNDGKRN